MRPFVPMTALELELEHFPLELLGRRDQDAEPYVSPSQIKMASRCLEQYRRRYVLGDKDRPAGALIWGGADHFAVEQNYREKIVTHKDLPVDDVKMMFAVELDKEVEKSGGPTEVEWKAGAGVYTGDDARKAHADVKDAGVRLVGQYQDIVAPIVQPTQVEEEFTIEVPGVPVKIKGHIDVQGLIGLGFGPPVERILERKTSGRNQVNNEWHIQRKIYQLVKALPLEFQLSLKYKDPKVIYHQYVYEPGDAELTIKQLQGILGLIASCYRIYGPDNPWPATGFGGFSDTCGFCGFKPTCSFHQ